MSPRSVLFWRLWGAVGVAAGVSAGIASCTAENPTYPLLSSSSGGQGGTSTTAGPTCGDGIKNQNESDVDCGGPCAKCPDGLACRTNSDCESGTCPEDVLVCTTLGCADKILNGDETDVDCGGTCPKCKDDKACLVDGDCASGFCNDELAMPACQKPNCTDAARNGNETDVDCGGACPQCQDGDGCAVDGDCVSGFCNTGLTAPACATPSCNDKFPNGDETDVDCGGPCTTKCAAGQKCSVHADCASAVCTGGVCIASSCADGIKNGTESDVDCGGTGGCNRCKLTEHCTIAADCQSQTCTGGVCVCPSGMITSPKIGGGVFCIDQKEVNYKQYLAFYTANPALASQPAECQWNTNYTPMGDWPALPGHDDEPVRYVNWCQAEAFCRYNNKHLCGSLAGGPSAMDKLADANVSAWYSACSAQGTSAYPYGNTFQDTFCVSALKPVDGGIASPAVAGSSPSCQGGTPTLLDMSGNVAEWEDSCSASTGTTDSCLVRGGSFQSSTVQSLRCDSGGTGDGKARNYTGPDVGIRCCL